MVFAVSSARFLQRRGIIFDGGRVCVHLPRQVREQGLQIAERVAGQLRAVDDLLRHHLEAPRDQGRIGIRGRGLRLERFRLIDQRLEIVDPALAGRRVDVGLQRLGDAGLDVGNLRGRGRKDIRRAVEPEIVLLIEAVQFADDLLRFVVRRRDLLTRAIALRLDELIDLIVDLLHRRER
jgi:hypothetical protein